MFVYNGHYIEIQSDYHLYPGDIMLYIKGAVVMPLSIILLTH